MNRVAHQLHANPFNYQIVCDPKAYYGRQTELETICDNLRGDSPRCCAIIGESYIGKTSLLRYLTHPQGAAMQNTLEIEHLIFVYLDASAYLDLSSSEHTSVQFWWDLLQALQTKLDPNHYSTKQHLPKIGANRNLIDKAYDIKSDLEKLIQAQKRPIVFALDNFQGIASLPLSDSAWLRALATDYNCAYVVTSRHLLYLLYHSESWERPSPVWNLFSDRVYLGLLTEEEAIEFILQRGRLSDFWLKQDIEFIRKTARRHPEFLRMTCASLYERRKQSRENLDPEEYEFLESRIYRDASPICNQLWFGLADPELLGISRSAEPQRDPLKLSMHQKVLMEIAAEGDSSADRTYLFELEERGMIERVEGKWQVFAEIMYQFILRQEQVRHISGQPTVFPAANESWGEQLTGNSTSRKAPPALTYLEGKVYHYLQSRAGAVCDKDEIKHAIWENKLPSDSTLQKIIERIRRKIEPDPDNPRYLIAVRGQGYMLRES